jgi:hypothetical protein
MIDEGATALVTRDILAASSYSDLRCTLDRLKLGYGLLYVHLLPWFPLRRMSNDYARLCCRWLEDVEIGALLRELWKYRRVAMCVPWPRYLRGTGLRILGGSFNAILLSEVELYEDLRYRNELLQR